MNCWVSKDVENAICDFASNRLELGFQVKEGKNWFYFGIRLFLMMSFADER
jgi:hypothetical protein